VVPEVGRVDALCPVGQVIVVDGPGERGQRFGRCAGGVVESRSSAADGAKPTTVPPLSVHACIRLRMAVVFPAPAGAMASCNSVGSAHGTN